MHAGHFYRTRSAAAFAAFWHSGVNGSMPQREITPAQPTLEDEVSYLELTRYMRNQLLRDSDVMSMAWSH
jgi:asparagine synthase (glutamine-hydrolysing)